MGAATDTDAEKLTRAVRNPGRLVLGPTQTTGAFPYGGVNLGYHSDGEVVWHADYINARDPWTGRIVRIARNGADFPEIYALLQGVQWDEDALRAIFMTSRPAAAPAEVRIDGNQDPAVLRAWPPLLFVADDPQHKSYYLRRPYPTLSLREGVALSQELHAGLPVRFVPTPDREGSPRVPDWQCGKLEHITL